MAEQNAVATQQGTQVSVAAQVKSMISQDAVKKKFTEVLGQKAPQFWHPLRMWWPDQRS